jgi:hypothetical protein
MELPPCTKKEHAMTSETDSCGASQESIASRREFVAAVTVAAASSAAAAGAAQAQTPNLRFSNPPGMTKPAAYSHEPTGTAPAVPGNRRRQG